METSKSKNLILILLFIVLLINVSILITFFFLPHRREEKVVEKIRSFRNDKKECLMKEMNLDANQEEQFFKLRDEHKEKIHLFISESKNVKNYLIEALSVPNISLESDLYLYADSLGQIEYKIQKETIDYFLKMKQFLHKEQFDKLLDNFREVCGCKGSCQGKMNHKQAAQDDHQCKSHKN